MHTLLHYFYLVTVSLFHSFSPLLLSMIVHKLTRLCYHNSIVQTNFGVATCLGSAIYLFLLAYPASNSSVFKIYFLIR